MDGGQNATASLDAGEATIPAKVRRPVKAVSLSGLTPAFAAVDPPAFEWVDPAELLVDEAYQRGLSERSMTLIRKIITGFDWRRFKPPVVARTAGGLEVLDGQHTAIAAASHPAVTSIPVMVVDAAEAADRAQAFIGHNRDRLNITANQLHHAAVAAGDEDALTIEQVCGRAGVAVLKTMPAHGLFRPRQTMAVNAIGALINRRNAMKARQVLQVLAEADLAPINVMHIKAVEVLMFDPEYTGEVEPGDITTALIALGGDADREAAVYAVTHKIPKWRALAIVLFRKGRKRGRRRAD
jgi:hypothetical protein